MASIGSALELRAVPRLDGLAAACTLLLAIVGLSIAYPVFLIVVQSFNVADPGMPQVWSLQGWQTALSEPTLRSSLVNTVVLALVKQAITLPVAIAIADCYPARTSPGVAGSSSASGRRSSCRR